MGLTLEQRRALARARARVRAQEAERPAPPRASMPSREIVGGLSNFTRGIPFSADVSGATAGLVDAGAVALRRFGQGATPGHEELGDAFQGGYDRTIRNTRAFREDFQQRRPHTAAVLEGSGVVAPIALTLGASAPAQAAAQAPRVAPVTRGIFGSMSRRGGLRGFAAQSAEASTLGAGYGYAYGAGHQDQAGEAWPDRLHQGEEGAVVGAALGLVTPAAVNTLRAGSGLVNEHLVQPAWRAFVRAGERIPTPEPHSVGAFGRPQRPRRERTPAAPRPTIPGPAMSRIDALAERSRMSPEQLSDELAHARATPQGQVLVDVFGDAGTRTMRPLAQAPGETGQRVRDVLRDRARTAPRQIMDALTRRLGVGESRVAATARLEGDYRRLSAEAYEPLWARPPTPEAVALYEQRIAPMLSPDYPNPEVARVMQRAVRDADRQFNLDRENGFVRGSFGDNLPRRLHYIKVQLGALADFEAAKAGASGQRIAALRQLYFRFGDMLDSGSGPAIIPGYRAITSRAGDYHTAIRALDDGASWLRMSGEEVQAARARMSDFELEHARIGLADEIRHATRGGTNRNKNVALALDDPDIQSAVAAAFDNPAQAAEFLSLINGTGRPGAPGLYRLIDNAQQWGGGSSTFSNITHGEDNVTGAVAEMAGETLRGEPGRALMRGARQIGNFFSNDAIEHANNQAGEVLLRRIDGPEAQAFADEVVRLYRQRVQRRTATARVSRATAAAVGGAPQRMKQSER